MMTKFKYWNENPNGEHIGDCVVRAITLASGLPYEEVKYKLWLNGELHDCDCISKFCYSNFIENVLGYKQIPCDDLTVGEFADEHPFGVYLIRINGHLTCIKNGQCYDIWNCLNELCDTVWKVN